MSEDCTSLAAPRRVGRPPVGQSAAPQPLSIRLPPDLHDAICRIALARGEPVTVIIRGVLLRAFLPDDEFRS